MEKIAENRKRNLFYFNRSTETDMKYSKSISSYNNFAFAQDHNYHNYVVDWQLENDDDEMLTD